MRLAQRFIAGNLLPSEKASPGGTIEAAAAFSRPAGTGLFEGRAMRPLMLARSNHWHPCAPRAAAEPRPGWAVAVCSPAWSAAECGDIDGVPIRAPTGRRIRAGLHGATEQATVETSRLREGFRHPLRGFRGAGGHSIPRVALRFTRG